MRKMDEETTSIADKSRSKCRKKTFRLPISCLKLKHLLMRQEEEGEAINKFNDLEMSEKGFVDPCKDKGN